MRITKKKHELFITFAPNGFNQMALADKQR